MEAAGLDHSGLVIASFFADTHENSRGEEEPITPAMQSSAGEWGKSASMYSSLDPV